MLLIGARQVGKSTLAQELTKANWPARYLTLDNRAVLDAALTNPDGMVQGLDLPVILDEVQRAPDLLRSVKMTVDQERQPGMFLLTGSAQCLDHVPRSLKPWPAGWRFISCILFHGPRSSARHPRMCWSKYSMQMTSRGLCEDCP